jgi:alkanesulfonate monooxygenase SsuD/methylene tetrahydromethanopterin reductase-like flavin-dependent oxidoreductase (luciferase family)
VRRTARYGVGWLAGVEAPEHIGKAVEAINAEAAAIGRPMDPEHFGAGFSYRFGPADDPAVEARRASFRKAFPGRNFDRVIITGGAADIVQRVREFQAAGITKFIARPIGHGDDDFGDQTQRLIEEVLPVVHGWNEAAPTA